MEVEQAEVESLTATCSPREKKAQGLQPLGFGGQPLGFGGQPLGFAKPCF